MKKLIFATLATLCLSQCEQAPLTEAQMSEGACKLFKDNNNDPKIYKPLVSQALSGDSKKSWTIASTILSQWGETAHSMVYEDAEKLRRLGNAWMQLARRQDSPLAIIDCVNCVNGMDITPKFEDEDAAKDALEDAKKLLLDIAKRDETEERYLQSLSK